MDPDAPQASIEENSQKLAELQESYAKATEEEKVFQAKVGTKRAALEKEIKHIQMDREDLEKDNEEDTKILKDKNASPEEKETARERIKTRDEEKRLITARLEESDVERSLLERVKDIFQKYGLTVAAIILAAGTTIIIYIYLGAVIGALTRGLKTTGKTLGNGLKEIGKIASILP